MKKILLFIKTPPPIGGATMMNQLVYDSKLLRKNFIVRAIKIQYVKEINEMGEISIFKFFTFINILKLLLFELTFNRPQLIYFQISPLGYAFLRDFIYVCLIKLFNIKIVYHLHGQGINNVVQKSIIRKNLYKYAFNKSYVICLSKVLTNDLKEIYSGIPYIVSNAIKRKKHKINTNSKNENVTILLISNLIESKGILDFLDAIEILNKRKLFFNATIIGKEIDYTRSDMDIYLRERNIQSITKYLGPKYGTDKYQELMNSDIFVFPTCYDTWGLVVLEAMQVGLPVVSTNEGSLPEIIIDGKTGYLVEKHNPIQLAEKIAILIKSENLRSEMGEAARQKFIEKYTSDIFEKNMLNVFNEIFNNKILQ